MKTRIKINVPVIAIVTLIVYIAILVRIMVFKDMPLIRIGPLMFNFGGTHEGPANFLPFRSILPYLFGERGLIIAIINLAGNIVLFVPMGFLVPFVYRNMTWKKSLVLAIVAGFTIEITQVMLGVGIFDIDDIILNALGVMIGFRIFGTLAKWVHSKNYKNIVVASIVVVAATAGMLYVIYPKSRQLVNSRTSVGDVQSDRINNEIAEIAQNGDLCGGTGGTGQIMSVGNIAITIKRNDGLIQTIKFTNRTSIKTSAGPASIADLKVGDRVTLVIDESETAAVVLVCNLSHPNSRSGK